MPLTRDHLDRMKCSNPDCNGIHPLVLHSKCHPEDPTWVWYDSRKGVLTVRCSVCERDVVEISVAQEHSH